MAAIHDHITRPIKKVMGLNANTDPLSVLLEVGILPLEYLRQLRLLLYCKRLSNISDDIKHPARNQFLGSSSPPDTPNAPKYLLSLVSEVFTLVDSLGLRKRSYERQKPALLLAFRTTSKQLIIDKMHNRALTEVKKLHQHSPTKYASSYTCQPYLYLDTPRIARIRARLRFKQATFNQMEYMKMIGKSIESKSVDNKPSPYCATCKSEFETLEHVLLMCPRYNDARNVCRAALKPTKTSLSINLILAHGLSGKHMKKILEATGLFILSVYNSRPF
jgi:hypothetical protein